MKLNVELPSITSVFSLSAVFLLTNKSLTLDCIHLRAAVANLRKANAAVSLYTPNCDAVSGIIVIQFNLTYLSSEFFVLRWFYRHYRQS